MPKTIPRISIVTPSLNQAYYLEECIESVLGQDYPNLEYIIMDGGSTDGSAEIIKKYEKYLTYWQSMPDGGHYQAINAGFDHTTGDLMAWLNADDKYHPLAFTKVACVFDMNPDVHWLTGRMCYWSHEGDLVNINRNLPVFSRLKYLSGHFDKPYIQQESTFWRRDLWNKAGASIDTASKLAGDLGLWSRFFRHESLYTVDTCLGGYRHYGDQRGVAKADEYYREACNLIAQEQILFRQAPLELPAASTPLSLSRAQVAHFMTETGITVDTPSRRCCWRHYTENLIGMVNDIYRERNLSLAPFFNNEILILGLIKQSAITLTADRLEVVSAIMSQAKTFRAQGDASAISGDSSAAIAVYRKALELWPYDIDTASRLLKVLLQDRNIPEALSVMARFLPIAAHFREFVAIAVDLLCKIGAKDQATGLCEEYLMINPHDAGIKLKLEQVQ